MTVRMFNAFDAFEPACLGCGTPCRPLSQMQVFDPETCRVEWPYCREC